MTTISLFGFFVVLAVIASIADHTISEESVKRAPQVYKKATRDSLAPLPNDSSSPERTNSLQDPQSMLVVDLPPEVLARMCSKVEDVSANNTQNPSNTATENSSTPRSPLDLSAEVNGTGSPNDLAQEAEEHPRPVEEQPQEVAKRSEVGMTLFGKLVVCWLRCVEV